MAKSLVGRAAHHDVPVSRFAIQAFQAGPESGYIAQALFPVIKVSKQNDRYYVIDKASYLRTNDSARSRGAPANRVEWKVTSEQYFADNYALADEIPLEDIDNADNVLDVRQGSAEFIVDQLMRDREVRIASKVTSISNVGSGINVQSLTGTTANQWTAVKSADILGQVGTASAFIQQNTGIVPNTMVLDWESFDLMRRNERLLELYKYSQGGKMKVDDLKSLFGIQNIWVGNAVKNTALEGAAATMTPVWGDNCLICHVNPRVKSKRVATFGLGMRWTPSGFSTPMQVKRSRIDHAGSEMVEVLEAGYYQDEKIVGQELSYLIANTR